MQYNPLALPSRYFMTPYLRTGWLFSGGFWHASVRVADLLDRNR